MTIRAHASNALASAAFSDELGALSAGFGVV
jgi:hypothetical protein